MSQNSLTVFVSSSRDMAEWAALIVAHVREFAVRHGLTDLHVLDYRDIDPADLDHSATWQDSVGAPSRIGASLTFVLLGERLGTPLPSTFRLKQDIYERLQRDGHDWVHVAGMTPLAPQPGQVPLTGVLFEFFDAFLPRADNSRPGTLRVIFKGTADAVGEPDFGNGDFRAQIEDTVETAQRKRQLRKEYDQQLDWMNLFWSKLYGLQQHASVFCPDQIAFQECLERTLTSEFLAQSNSTPAFSKPHIDARKVDLPGPAPYDLDRAAFFLGRGPQLAELTRRALQHEAPRRLVPVVGESGAGKSSLLRAGLLNDACSPSRRRLGWRVAFLSLSERPVDQRPLLFLSEALAEASALPELGPTDALRQRLDGVDPWIAARRLLDILASVDVAHSPGLGRPKLLLVVDQLELALDGARLEAPEVASEWMAFLQVLAALGDALLDPAMREALEETAKRVGDRLPCAVVLGLPADRSSAFGAALRPGDLVFPLPRLVDETALREVVTGTFAALGLTIEPEARESLCREAVSLAEGTEASILPLLGVTLTALHDEWKIRCELEAKWKEYADDLTTMPMSLVLLGVIPPGDSRVDIALKHVNEHGRIDKAMARLGELAWNEAEEKEPWIKRNLVSLPITSQRQQVESGEITARDFALAWLLRHLVSVSADETIRLKSLPDHSLEAFARPMAEALRRHRLLTRRDDGTWWLAHQAVLVNWPRAAKWKEAEMQIYRTMATMEMDRRRWLEEREAGDFDAGRWLWMRERQVERAIEWMFLLGMHDNPDLAMFAKEGMIASVAQDGIRAGRILRVAAYLNDAAWSEAILQAAVSNATAASNELNKNGDGSALKNACLHGNTTLVRLLMQHGAHPDLVHANGWTPLLLAAQVGASEVCDLLLAAGAEVNHATKDGWTALMVAAQNGHDTVVAQLLAAGADVSHVSSDGWTALKIAAQNGHGAIVASLLATGADIGDATSNGWTALTGAAENGHDAVVAHLLSAGANVNRVTNDGWTALTMASENGHDTVVAHLLAARADVNHVTNDGWTALNCAAKNGHDLIVALLVSAGAAVDNAADKEQRVALILAAENGHYAVVDCLLSLGAKVDHEDCGGRTALIVASQNGHYAVVERLIAAEAKVPHGTNRKSSALIKAAEGGHEVVITLLIAAGAEANHVDANGSSALLKAVQNGNKAIAARLITSRPNANLGNVEGATALTEAIMNRDKEMVQLLLSHGADPMLQNNTDLSALEIAHKRNAKSIIKLLVEAGVPPLSEDELHILQSKRIKEGNIGLVVNARGKVCLVHDFKFLATPLLVGYHVDKKQIEIFYDTGESYPIEWEATDEMHNLLSKIDKILLIRMKEKRPVEGYDTSFLIMRTGKPIESESEVPPSPEGELQNIQREPIKKATSALSSTHSEKSA